jgi:hypothetical protein
MYARIAQFEVETGSIDDMLGPIRESLERGMEGMSDEEREQMAGFEGVRRVLVLVDRNSGRVANLVLCDTDEDLRKADEALNRMSPQGGGRRTSVDLYEVAIDKEMGAS